MVERNGLTSDKPTQVHPVPFFRCTGRTGGPEEGIRMPRSGEDKPTQVHPVLLSR